MKHHITYCHDCSAQTPENKQYRCRICNHTYCSECSLKHFGLHEKNGEVKHKNVLKTILWLIRKRLTGR